MVLSCPSCLSRAARLPLERSGSIPRNGLDNTGGLGEETHSDVSSHASGSGRSTPGAWVHTVWHEVCRVLALAGPTSVVDTISFCASLFSVSQVGLLGYKELSAMTLGNTLFNITGLSIIVGITSGMDTFCGQVYGAGQFGALGIIWQRAVLLCAASCLPSFCVWMYARPILVALGQPADVSRMAELYIWAASPCLVLTGVKCCCRSYFSSQGVVVPVTIITFACVLLVPLYNWILIDLLGYGLIGAAMAYVVEEVTSVLLLSGLMVWHNRRLPPGRKTWSGWSCHAFTGWWMYLEVAVPSMAMICLDWWILEVMILLAGLGPDPDIQVAAMGLLFNTFTFVYYTVDGFGAAASTRVSHALGGSHPAGARLASGVSLLLGLIACIVVSMVLYSTQGCWTDLFSRSIEVQRLIHQTMPCVVAAVLGYSGNTVLSGVLRGANRQNVGFKVNLVTLWMVGLPVSAFLSLYLDYGLVGLWIGIALMNLLQGGILAYKVAHFDWYHEVQRSRSFVTLCTPLMQSDFNLTSHWDAEGNTPSRAPSCFLEDEEPELSNGNSAAGHAMSCDMVAAGPQQRWEDGTSASRCDGQLDASLRDCRTEGEVSRRGCGEPVQADEFVLDRGVVRPTSSWLPMPSCLSQSTSSTSFIAPVPEHGTCQVQVAITEDGVQRGGTANDTALSSRT